MPNAILLTLALIAQTTPVEFPANALILLGADGTIRQFSAIDYVETDHAMPGATDLAIGPDGLLYVVEPTQIQAVDANFDVYRTIESGDPNSQYGAIAFDSRGRVVVTDANTNTLVTFAADGSVAATHAGEGGLAGLTDLAIGNNGHMYVACESQGVVRELDASGSEVTNIPMPDANVVEIGTGGTLFMSTYQQGWLYGVAMRAGLSQGAITGIQVESMCPAGIGTYFANDANGDVWAIRSTGWSIENLDRLFMFGTPLAISIAVVPQRLKFKAVADFTNGDIVGKSVVKGVMTIWPDGNLVAITIPTEKATEYRMLRGSAYGAGGGAGKTEGSTKAMIGGSAVEDGAPFVTVSTLRLGVTGAFQGEYTQTYDEFFRFIVSEAKGTFTEVAGDGVRRLRIESTKKLN